jgi:hypothetical protein
MRQTKAPVRDRMNQRLAVGQRVRLLTDPPEEGIVRRIVPRYDVLTVIVDAKAGKSERMVRAQDVEASAGTT